MRWKAWWREFFAFTPTERKAALLIAAAFLVGLGIRWYHSATEPAVAYDYRASDSTFAALSHAPEGAEEAQGDSIVLRTVDLNTATKEELVGLPGIGSATAERILLYREDVGPFRNVSDLMKVRGIGRKKFEQLKHLITVH